MNRIICYLPMVALLLTGCGKKISHNSGMFWNDSSKSNVDYNADVFSGSNNAIQYNAPTAQAKNNSQEPAFNYQANSQLYNVSQNDTQITQAVNGSYNAKQSNLAKQEGQIDLMQNSKYDSRQNSDNNNLQQDVCGKCSSKCVDKGNTKVQENGCDGSIEGTKKPVKEENVAPKSYKIQAGYYISEHSANDVANALRNAGINNVSVITEKGGSKIYVGSFQDRYACDALLAQVRKVHADAFVVFK